MWHPTGTCLARSFVHLAQRGFGRCRSTRGLALRKEAGLFCRTNSSLTSVRLYWKLKEIERLNPPRTLRLPDAHRVELLTLDRTSPAPPRSIRARRCFVSLNSRSDVERIWHIRQSRPDSGLAFKVKVLKTFGVTYYSLGSNPLTFSERYAVSVSGARGTKGCKGVSCTE